MIEFRPKKILEQVWNLLIINLDEDSTSWGYDENIEICNNSP